MCCMTTVQDGLFSVYSHCKLSEFIASQMRKAGWTVKKQWCFGEQNYLLWPEQVRHWLIMLLQGYFNKVRNSSMGIQQFLVLLCFTQQRTNEMYSFIDKDRKAPLKCGVFASQKSLRRGVVWCGGSLQCAGASLPAWCVLYAGSANIMVFALWQQPFYKCFSACWHNILWATVWHILLLW